MKALFILLAVLFINPIFTYAYDFECGGHDFKLDKDIPTMSFSAYVTDTDLKPNPNYPEGVSVYKFVKLYEAANAWYWAEISFALDKEYATTLAIGKYEPNSNKEIISSYIGFDETRYEDKMIGVSDENLMLICSIVKN